MSDPARDGYECHGRMAEIQLLRIHQGTSAFLCLECGCWRHALPYSDPRRAQVVAAMPAIIDAHLVGSRGTVE